MLLKSKKLANLKLSKELLVPLLIKYLTTVLSSISIFLIKNFNAKINEVIVLTIKITKNKILFFKTAGVLKRFLIISPS